MMRLCQRILCRSVLCLLIFVHTTRGEVVFLKVPSSLNISYGETASFYCSVRGDEYGGRPYWILKGEEIQGVTTLKEGYEIWYNGSGLVRSSMLLVNGSFYANNNLEIQCQARNIISDTAILRIRGLTSTLNISIPMRNEKSVLLKWSTPDIFIDAHNYTIIISNFAADTEYNVTVGGGVKEYNFIPRNNNDYCSLLKFCVLSLRQNVLGDISGCITTSLRRGIIMDGPEESTLSSSSASLVSYLCHVTCSEGTLFTWLANGQQLSSLSYLNTTRSSNFKTVCNAGDSNTTSTVSELYTEYLEIHTSESSSMEVQCLSVFHCHNNSMECHPSVCLSQRALVPQLAKGNDFQSNSSTVSFFKKEDSQSGGSSIISSNNFDKVHIMTGTTAGLGVILIIVCTISIALLVLYLKQKKKHRKALFTSASNPLHQEEDIYTTCGGPSLKNESVYDKPKSPSPPHAMQQCEAYSVLPLTS